MKKSQILYHIIAVVLSVLVLFNYHNLLNKLSPVQGGFEEIVIALFTIYAMEKILNFIKFILIGKNEKVEEFLDSLKGIDE
ncbi:hypothetical protein [Lagierella sp.]|uniref:hypothetical protein n=1 Tax=Lagierella sp. TaxID=2849657 RepID=UPI002614187F|nr:hypothetical protein [Lagierella sp.]